MIRSTARQMRVLSWLHGEIDPCSVLPETQVAVAEFMCGLLSASPASRFEHLIMPDHEGNQHPQLRAVPEPVHVIHLVA